MKITVAKVLHVIFKKPKAVLRIVYNVIIMGAQLKESHSNDSEQLAVPATSVILERLENKMEAI
jgi:hypothetical protein